MERSNQVVLNLTKLKSSSVKILLHFRNPNACYRLLRALILNVKRAIGCKTWKIVKLGNFSVEDKHLKNNIWGWGWVERCFMITELLAILFYFVANLFCPFISVTRVAVSPGSLVNNQSLLSMGDCW